MVFREPCETTLYWASMVCHAGYHLLLARLMGSSHQRLAPVDSQVRRSQRMHAHWLILPGMIAFQGTPCQLALLEDPAHHHSPGNQELIRMDSGKCDVNRFQKVIQQ